VAVKNPDCAKLMTVWCALAVALVTVFLMAGYALFESAGASPDPSTRTASERFRRPLRYLESHGRSLL
jgi:hypothetical protein